MKIYRIEASEILDSRGNPTVQANVYVKGGITGIAKVPSGASTGIHEALELRDKQKRYHGKGVLKACKHVNEIIAPALLGVKAMQQRRIDEIMMELDGTENKSKLGANAILAVSLACAHAASQAKNVPLYAYIHQLFTQEFLSHASKTNFLLKRLPEKWAMPLPMMNILNGGAHASFSVDVQEFMIIPKAPTMAKRVQMGAEVFHTLKDILKAHGYTTLVGDEGGYAPKLPSNQEAFELILQAVRKSGYIAGKHIFLAIDSAASEFYQKNKKAYVLASEGKTLSASDLIELYQEWIAKYPIISIEDGLHEDDWKHWREMTKKLGKKVMLVGDDLFVTNIERLSKGIEQQIGNAILIKLNQIGTLTQTLQAIALAKEHGYENVISHRSGETEDTFIADLAVGINSKYIKTGSLSRSERVAKYNRLMEIEKTG